MTTFYAQSNQDLAKAYFKRAEKTLFENIDPDGALIQFNKGIKYTDSIKNAKIAWLGTRINYELSNLKDCKKYAKQYFTLAKNKNSEEYTQFLDLYILIEEELEKQIAEEKRIEAERLRKENELQRIDSLKIVWKNTSKEFEIKADSIYSFNKNNVALFKSGENFGLINDRGTILLDADTYKNANAFEGYFLLMDTKNEPTKIYSYNTEKKEGFTLPIISDFNPISTHYGKVMLPRGNGRIVTYPNNSYSVMVYDLNQRKFVKIANKKDLFKSLKKTDKIDNYNKKGTVKVHKKWYGFGGHIGGGIHPLFAKETYNLTGFLFSIDGSVATLDKFSYLGAFYNNKTQAIKGDKTFWINQNGTKVKAPKNKSSKYTGNSKVRKLENGTYQVIQKNFIILGDRKLERMAGFLRKHNPKQEETPTKE